MEVVVPTPGIPVELSQIDFWVGSFTVIAYPENTGVIALSTTVAVKATAPIRGIPLFRGDLRDYSPGKRNYNLKDYWIDASVGGEGVHVTIDLASNSNL